MALVLKKAATVAIRVDIAIPPEDPIIKGFLMCDAVVRGRKELEELQGKLESGEYADDAALLRNGEIFTAIHGLAVDDSGELEPAAAMKEVLEGQWSVYLTTALLRRYFEHFREAGAKNLKTLRGR